MAVKVIETKKMTEREIRYIRDEVETLRVMSDADGASKGIVRLMDVFEESQTIKLVQEFIEGNTLFRWVIGTHKANNFSEQLSRIMFSKIIKSL